MGVPKTTQTRFYGWQCAGNPGHRRTTQVLTLCLLFFSFTDTKLFPAISQQSLKINVAFKRNKKDIGMGLLEYMFLCPMLSAHCHPRV